MILTEEYFETVTPIVENVGDQKKTYITGIMSVAEEKNRNGRIYSQKDIMTMEKTINDAAAENRHILGACDHPNTLEVRLDEVSHRLMEAKVDGSKLMFKAEILEKHPKGAIVKALIDSGVQVGVSTRGSGSVNESTGRVSNFRFVTLDCVANPSCPHSYTSSIREQMEMYGRGEMITDLSEAAVHDPLAQKYFEIEMRKFINSLRG